MKYTPPPTGRMKNPITATGARKRKRNRYGTSHRQGQEEPRQSKVRYQGDWQGDLRNNRRGGAGNPRLPLVSIREHCVGWSARYRDFTRTQPSRKRASLKSEDFSVCDCIIFITKLRSKPFCGVRRKGRQVKLPIATSFTRSSAGCSIRRRRFYCQTRTQLAVWHAHTR